MSYLTVAAHRSMALDVARNDAYGAALAEAVRPASVVLDLGAGTGIHGLMAARLGARRVYLVEPEDIISVAEEIVAANGLQETVTCVQGRIEDVSLPEPVDIIVSVLTGNFLLTEDLLRSLFHARDTVLKPGGLLLPCAAAMEAVPVSAPSLHATEIAGWSSVRHGIDLSPARAYAANTIFYRSEELRRAAYLADPRTLHTLDFHRDGYGSLQAAATYPITESGTCHGWAGWFSMKLGDRWLSTSPRDALLHWSPAFLPLDPPLTFERGERVSFGLTRAPLGDWTWTVRCGTASQQRSTLLSAPLRAATLKKAALDYHPALNIDGCAVMHVLSRCDGSTGVESIARSLREQDPGRYRSDADALALVQRLVKRYA